VSRGTAVELFWEYPNGVVLLRDAMWKKEATKPRTGPRLDHAVVMAADHDKTMKFYTDVLGLKRNPAAFGIPGEVKGVGAMKNTFVDANGFCLEVVQPTASGPGMDLLQKHGDGYLMELDTEVNDIDAYYEQMKSKGITMVDLDGRALPAGNKAVTLPSGDRYSYFPLSVSRGMRIMVYQRGLSDTSILRRRDEAAKK